MQVIKHIVNNVHRSLMFMGCLGPKVLLVFGMKGKVFYLESIGIVSLLPF